MKTSNDLTTIVSKNRVIDTFFYRLRSSAKYFAPVVLAGALSGYACGGDNNTPPNEPPVVPIDRPDVMPGEDPINRDPRPLDPESFANFYLETNAIRNEEGNAYAEVILLQPAVGVDQIVSLNNMSGYASVDDYAAGQAGITLLTYNVFADYVFGVPDAEGNRFGGPILSDGYTLLEHIQELYRTTGREAMNLPMGEAADAEADRQLVAVLHALYNNEPPRGIQGDDVHPIVAGRTEMGTSFIAFPVMNDGANQYLMAACGGCLPNETPVHGEIYGSYSRLAPERMDAVVRGMVEMNTTGF